MLLYYLSNRPIIAVLYLYFALLQVTVADFDGWGEGKRDSQSDTYWENRLWGNSFGVPGFNETYDYVVSLKFLIVFAVSYSKLCLFVYEVLNLISQLTSIHSSRSLEVEQLAIPWLHV